MTIAYLIVKSRNKKPIKKRVPYSPFLPVYWRKKDAVFESVRLKGTEVIRVLIEKTLLSHSGMKKKYVTHKIKKGMVKADPSLLTPREQVIHMRTLLYNDIDI